MQSIVEQQRVLAETINMMVRNGATGAGLATTIVAENVRMNWTMMIDRFTLQFGSEDRDKDALNWPELKFKLRNHLAVIDQAYIVDMDNMIDADRGEELDISLATDDLQFRALMLYGLLVKTLKQRPLDLCEVSEGSQRLRGLQTLVE